MLTTSGGHWLASFYLYFKGLSLPNSETRNTLLICPVDLL